MPLLIGVARAKSVSAYVGDGQHRWAAVHKLDAAELYRLALEKGSAGSRYHAVADEGVRTRDIAEAIGRRLKVPVVSVSKAEAGEHFGFVAYVFGVDVQGSSTRTQELLGWRPRHIGLLEDLEKGSYFQ